MDNDPVSVDEMFDALLNAAEEAMEGRPTPTSTVMSAAMYLVVESAFAVNPDPNIFREELTRSIEGIIADCAQSDYKRRMQ